MSPTTVYDLSECCCGVDLPVEDCPDCYPAPLHFTVAIGGITDAICTGCNTWNGGYIMEHVPGTCRWEQTALLFCGVTKATVTISGGSMFFGLRTPMFFHALWTNTGPMNCQGTTILDSLITDTGNCDLSAVPSVTVHAA